MKLGVVLNLKRKGVNEALEVIRATWPSPIYISEPDAKLSTEKDIVIPEYDFPKYVDIVVSLGGDGTFLRATRVAAGKPVVGINLGGLGFLTFYRPDELRNVLNHLIHGKYEIEERMTLNALYNNKSFFALNDMVVTATGAARLITVEVYHQNELLNRYKADGVIVSTPTGSTAYNLAAGGPILFPRLQVVIVTPICAHALTVRPVILPIDSGVTIRPVSKGVDILLSADGQVQEVIESGTSVNIVKGENARFVLIPEAPKFYDVLRQKLNWG